MMALGAPISIIPIDIDEKTWEGLANHSGKAISGSERSWFDINAYELMSLIVTLKNRTSLPWYAPFVLAINELIPDLAKQGKDQIYRFVAPRTYSETDEVLF